MAGIGSHIIPRFYLERFSTPSTRGKNNPGRLWVYEPGKEASERSTRVQGFENGYFAYMHPDGSPNGRLEQIFERDLAIREGECNETLACARSDLFHWPSSSREKLAFYSALLYSRATQRRNHNQKNHKSIVTQLRQAVEDSELVREIAFGLTVELGRAVSEDIVRKGINVFLEKAEKPTTARNAFLADLLGNTQMIASILLKKEPWCVLRPPDGFEFVTTDNPLVTFVPLGNGILHPGYGFNKVEAAAVFPLAPDACLLMGAAWQVSRTLDATANRELNTALISICDRYVYSRTFSGEIQELVSKYAGTVRYGENAFVPVGLKLPSARQFIRSSFGLPPE